MFSWIGNKEGQLPMPAPSFDPLKGGQGAVAFYKQTPSAAAGLQSPKVNGKSSAAIYYQAQGGGGGGAAAAAAAGGGGAGVAADSLVLFEDVAEVNRFLREGNEKLKQLRHYSETRTLFKFVMGNEAADLDSMVSAICYAYFLAAQAPPGGGVVHVPLVNVWRGDFHLRTEAAWLFKAMGLDTSALLFVDEVDLPELQAQGTLQLVLVDHNRLSERQENLQHSVVSVIDHHKDENQYTWAEPRTVAQVGSCSTLVARIISEEAAPLLSNRSICRLLLAAILVDTNNLDASAGRCEPEDETMAALLIAGAGPAGRTPFFEQLREKKYDLLGLTTLELLRRDYKQFQAGPGTSGGKGEVVNVGIAAVGISLAEFIGKDPLFDQVVKAFSVERELHVLVLMTMYYAPSSKKFKRELAFITSVPSLLNGLCYFMQNDKQNLNLKPITVRGLPSNTRAFSQGNVAASRKQIQPLLLMHFTNAISK